MTEKLQPQESILKQFVEEEKKTQKRIYINLRSLNNILRVLY